MKKQIFLTITVLVLLSSIVLAQMEDFYTIRINNAQHLDENKNVLSNEFSLVNKSDGIYSSPIYNNEYLRVNFTEPLGTENEISIYITSNQTYQNSSIQFFKKDGTYLGQKYLRNNPSNPIRTHLVFNLWDIVGYTSSFDLKLNNDDGINTTFIQFDLVIDPAIDCSSFLNTNSTSYYLTDGNITCNFLQAGNKNVILDNVSLYTLGGDNTLFINTTSDFNWYSGILYDLQGGSIRLYANNIYANVNLTDSQFPNFIKTGSEDGSIIELIAQGSVTIIGGLGSFATDGTSGLTGGDGGRSKNINITVLGNMNITNTLATRAGSGGSTSGGNNGGAGGNSGNVTINVGNNIYSYEISTFGGFGGNCASASCGGGGSGGKAENIFVKSNYLTTSTLITSSTGSGGLGIGNGCGDAGGGSSQRTGDIFLNITNDIITPIINTQGGTGGSSQRDGSGAGGNAGNITIYSNNLYVSEQISSLGGTGGDHGGNVCGDLSTGGNAGNININVVSNINTKNIKSSAGDSGLSSAVGDYGTPGFSDSVSVKSNNLIINQTLISKQGLDSNLAEFLGGFVFLRIEGIMDFKNHSISPNFNVDGYNFTNITFATTPFGQLNYESNSSNIWTFNYTDNQLFKFIVRSSNLNLSIFPSPSVTSILLFTFSGNNQTSENLLSSVTYDLPIITQKTRWFKNLVEQTNLENQTAVSDSLTTVGDTWQFCAFGININNVSGNQACSNNLRILDGLPPSNTNRFNGSTTNFSLISNYKAIQPFILEIFPFGKIEWKNAVNADQANLNNINITQNFVSVLSQNLHSSFNSPANVTLYGLTGINTPIVKKNGVTCTTCNILRFNGSTIEFSTTGFSNFTIFDAVTLTGDTYHQELDLQTISLLIEKDANTTDANATITYNSKFLNLTKVTTSTDITFSSSFVTPNTSANVSRFVLANFTVFKTNGNLNSTLNFTQNVSTIVPIFTFSNPVLQTTEQTMNILLQGIDINYDIQSSILYNKTSSLNITMFIQQNSTDTVIYNNFTTPNLNGVVPFNITVNITRQGVTSQKFINRNQTITNIGLDACTVFNIRTLNITVQDITTFAVLNTVTQTNFNIYLSDPANSKFVQLNYSGGAGSQPYTVCISPNSTFFVDGTIQYDPTAAGYPAQEYNFNNALFTNITIPLILYATTGGVLTQIQVISQDDQPLAGYFVQVQKCDIGTSTCVTSEIVKTGLNGVAYATIIQSTEFYKFLVFDPNNNLVLETDRVIITSSPITLRVGSASEYFDNFDTSQKVVCSCVYREETNDFKYVFSNPTGIPITGTLSVQKVIPVGDYQIAETSINTASGTIIIPLGNASLTGTFIASPTVTIVNNPSTNTFMCTDPATKSFDNTYQLFGAEGVWWTLIIFIVLITAGSWEPKVSLTFGVVGIILCLITGIFFMDWKVMITFIVISAVTIYKVNRV